jgi:ribosome recycling factor
MPLETAYKTFDAKAEETKEWFQQESVKVRTGRVTTDIVNSLFVDYYGTRSPLQGVASISLSDARTIVISPWDEGAIQAIEKAVTEAQLGVQPVVDGKVVRSTRWLKMLELD